MFLPLHSSLLRLIKLLVLCVACSSLARADDITMSFSGVEGKDTIYWRFYGSLTIKTATEYGPLNDAAWLYPNGSVGWSFFNNDGTGDDLVLKGATTIPTAGESYTWTIKDADGFVLETINVPITGWYINNSGQAIEPRTEAYTVPNLEVGDTLCISGTGSFKLQYDYINSKEETIDTALTNGERKRTSNGGDIIQTVNIYGASSVTSYEAWKASSLPGETDPNLVGPNADFDNDHASNLLEFATASDGATANKPEAYTISKENGKVCLTFKVRSNVPSLQYAIEYGSLLGDLKSTQLFFQANEGTWTASNVDPVLTSMNVGFVGDGVWIISICATVDNPTFFMRVKVTDQS